MDAEYWQWATTGDGLQRKRVECPEAAARENTLHLPVVDVVENGGVILRQATCC